MIRSKIHLFVLSFCLLVFLCSCASVPPPSPSSSPSSQQQSGDNRGVDAVTAVSRSSTDGQPAWLTATDSVFSRDSFVTGVGTGNNRNLAEKNALTALSSVFRNSLQADETITNSYQEMVRSGSTAVWTENTSVENAIKTSTSMELIGAEIREVWNDTKTNYYYAVAVMEIPKTARVYTQMIQDNQQILSNLLDIPADDRNSLDSLARYQFAITLAEVNQVFANVLSVIGSPVPAGIKRPEEYRTETANIMKSIPVSVIVENDRGNRIRDAFSSVLSAAGFKTGGNNTRYQLQAKFSLSEVQLPNQTIKFSRYVVDGNFVDTSTGAILFPYNINNREGHTTQSEADNRALAAAERKIKEDYSGTLTAYLSQLLPKK
ncbi:LPP20 family lipoprotein [Treponema primitia]|uniref:LPP20 family lipoprotein n=1 Tax=Treponema primitia TaxID=88058 RepID=UPI00397F93D7